MGHNERATRSPVTKQHHLPQAHSAEPTTRLEEPEKEEVAAETERFDPRLMTHNSIVRLQRVIGNQAVMRFLQRTPLLNLKAPASIQREWENTVEHATGLRDGGKITVFDDRVQHVVDEHGKTNGKVGVGWYRFTTDDNATIKGYIEGTLKVGSVKLGHRDSYDFEAVFTGPIGENVNGDTTKKMRVVVVKLGAKGDRGKIQTAYPIA